jgi:hypothetical protein
MEIIAGLPSGFHPPDGLLILTGAPGPCRQETGQDAAADVAAAEQDDVYFSPGTPTATRRVAGCLAAACVCIRPRPPGVRRHRRVGWQPRVPYGAGIVRS